MSRFDIGPDFVKLHYQSNGHQHVMQFSVKLADYPDPGEMPDFLTKENGQVAANLAMEALVATMRDLISNTSYFTSWDVFHKETPAADPVWLYTGAIVLGQGTVVSAAVPASQFAITYRSALGGHYRWQLMEGVIGANAVFPPQDISGGEALGDLNTLLVGPTAFVVARDGAYLTSPIRGVSKINDKLRRKYLVA